MSVALWNQYPQDIEQIVVAWLAPLRRSGNAYRGGDTLPFTLVTHIAGKENVWTQIDSPVVSVHTLTDKALGFANASLETQNTHRRMLQLNYDPVDITLPDGTIAAIEYVKIFQSPMWVRFENVQVLRQVGRYELGISYIYDNS